MELYIRDVDEYSKDLRQGNKFAPEWPFRMGVSGSSDSGKTTMLMNLLMGNKNIKEDGERYILCNDVVLIGKFLHEPKWIIVRDFLMSWLIKVRMYHSGPYHLQRSQMWKSSIQIEQL